MDLLSQPRFQFPPAFEQFPADLFRAVLQIDWKRTEELYREAYERALAVAQPAITDRLAPFWN